MKKGFLLMMLLPYFLKAQTPIEKEIQFESGLTWDQVKQKAKKDGKYIFVDYYATWCVPCRQMDRMVYSSEEVASFVNKSFIAVKVQMDTTNRDNDQVRKWYSTAHSFMQEYEITAFPSYLFFSPDGKIVHRESGFKMPDDFLKVVSDAIDTNIQIYTQLEKYKKGIKNFQTMPDLARRVNSILNDKNQAFQIANDYNKNYLNHLSKDDLLKKNNIEFITWYPKVLQSSDRYFDLFYRNGKKIDSVMNQVGYASKVIDGVISYEEISSKIYDDGKPIAESPNWKKLYDFIQRKYGKERAERNILNAKIFWYTKKNDWKNSIKYNVIKVEKNGIDTSYWGRFGLNNLVWDVIFQHSDDPVVLNKAAKWIETIMPFDERDTIIVKSTALYAGLLDTYANILYKASRIDEAIEWQTKAISFDLGNKNLQDHLEKMKRNEPTWVEAN